MDDTKLDDARPDAIKLREILASARTIAVVGASTNLEKAAHKVPELLIEAGYTVIPVHPTSAQILGQRAYPTLGDIPVPVDIVDVFRPSAEVAGVVEQAIAMGTPTVWVQLGITSEEGRRLATSAGVNYIEDRCIGEMVLAEGITVS